MTHHSSNVILPFPHQDLAEIVLDHLARELLHEPARTHLDPSTLEDTPKEPRSALHRPRFLGLPHVDLNVATTWQGCVRTVELARFPPGFVDV